jgi:hypothetical protein
MSTMRAKENVSSHAAAAIGWVVADVVVYENLEHLSFPLDPLYHCRLGGNIRFRFVGVAVFFYE